MTIEEELRETFVRHEHLTPEARPILAGVAAEAKRRRKKRTASRTAAVALMAVLAVLLPFGWQGLATALGGANGVFGSAAEPPKPMTFLLVGSDRTGDSPGRADSVMLVHVPKEGGKAYVVSIPRDVLVDIPGKGTEKLGHALAHGGLALMRRTVTDMTGVKLDGAATMELSGFTKVIGVLGGVNVCLDRAVRSVHTGHQFKKGCQQLNEHAALDLVRQRKSLPDGDLDRIRNQQKVLAATLDKAVGGGTLSDPVRVAALVRAAGSALTVDSSIPVNEVAGRLRGVRGKDLVSITVPVQAEGQGGYRLDGARAAALFDAIRRDTLATWK